MPRTPTTPTLLLCDDLVEHLRTQWGCSDPDGVRRAYFEPFGDAEDELSRVYGRQVVVFPTGYGTAYATRGADRYTHLVSVLTVERYEDGGGRPPDEWTDERVDWVHEFVVQGLDFNRDGPPSFNRQLGTLSADVQVCDVEKLVTGGRLFYALAVLEFEEYRTA
jgi:hypothetical protein